MDVELASRIIAGKRRFVYAIQRELTGKSRTTVWGYTLKCECGHVWKTNQPRKDAIEIARGHLVDHCAMDGENVFKLLEEGR